MELELSRIDYTLIGISSPNCMRLLPASDLNEPQKIAAADNDGILQVFSIKKGDMQLHFKTLPGDQISTLRLGGASGTISDKMFISSGNEVRGFTKKGKLFLSFDSNLTEPIVSMFVLGSDLFLCGRHIYNHYRDCKDLGSYLCGDSIVDVVAFHLHKSRRLIALIACEGRMIRALEHSRVTMSMEVESSPTILFIYEQDTEKYILFGTTDGRVGILDVEKLQSFSRWLIKNEKNSSAITCMESYDFLKNDVKNLVIGRNDGNIEVYSINLKDEYDKPSLVYSHNCNECVMSIQCGIVGNANYDEILVCTYTGRIFGLTTEPLDKNVGGDGSHGNVIFSADSTQKINRLKSDIEELQTKIQREREKYQSSTNSFLDEYSAIPMLNIKDFMVLCKEDASYSLTIEVPTPIDNVLLQSDAPVDLLDVEKNSAVVSYCEPQHEIGNFLLATYRCQVNTNRLEVKIRTVEGQSGTLQACVTPLLQPKCCQIRKFEIRPLSLHYRVHHFDESRPCNLLKITGNFSLAEIHSWIGQCIPEVPEKPQINERTVLIFQSTFLGTFLHCSYVKGEAEFKSDNVSPISILKDFMSKEATKKKIKISFSETINDESISHILRLIDPKLKQYSTLSRKIDLIDALHELEINDEESLSLLSPKYRELLVNEKSLRLQTSSQPSYLDRLHGIIKDLYVDYNKFKGINAHPKLPKLIKLLEQHNAEELILFFLGTTNTV